MGSTSGQWMALQGGATLPVTAQWAYQQLAAPVSVNMSLLTTFLAGVGVSATPEATADALALVTDEIVSVASLASWVNMADVGPIPVLVDAGVDPDLVSLAKVDDFYTRQPTVITGVILAVALLRRLGELSLPGTICRWCDDGWRVLLTSMLPLFTVARWPIPTTDVVFLEMRKLGLTDHAYLTETCSWWTFMVTAGNSAGWPASARLVHPVFADGNPNSAQVERFLTGTVTRSPQWWHTAMVEVAARPGSMADVVARVDAARSAAS